MTFPNLDNTFLASLSLYRKLRGGKWYLRMYFQFADKGWCRYGGESPMSTMIVMEDYNYDPPFIIMRGAK